MKKILLMCAFIGTTGALCASNLTANDINEQVIHSDDSDFNIGFKIGTLGAGIDISKPVNDWISLRVNANGFNYTTTDTSEYSSFLEADKEYNLRTVGLLADFNLLQLRVTAGLYVNNNTFTETTTPKNGKSIYLNNKLYNIGSIAEVKSTVTFNTLSPYVGVGWGNNGKHEGWNLTLDVGLMYHGDPQLDLEVKTNPAVPSIIVNAIEADALIEKEIQERDLSDFPFYPVVMIGLNYSF